MAHELTIRQDGYAEMAFVGETPWHGLGQELEAGADMAAWRKAAGMDWVIESAPVCYTTADFDQNTEQYINEARHTYPSRNVLYRSDTKAPLSVVSDRYKPVQPIEVLEFFNDLVTESGFRLHTAGTLFGGKRLWALAETGKFGEVSKGDGIGGFLLLSTSADKSLATTARFTSVRVVCNNTLGMATANDSSMVSFTHAREFDHEAMKAKLGKAVESFGAFMDMAKFLRKQKLNQAQANKFVADLLVKVSKIDDPDYSVLETRGFEKIMGLFDGGAKGADMAGYTKWGMLNAVTEYYDHHLPSRTNDARLNSAWFGSSDAFKAKAVDLLLA